MEKFVIYYIYSHVNYLNRIIVLIAWLVYYTIKDINRLVASLRTGVSNLARCWSQFT
jgi:hypothetical protein